MSVGVAVVCVPLFVVSLLVVLAVFRAHGDKPVHRCFMATGLMALLWQLTCIFEFLIQDEALLSYVFNWTKPFAAFVVLGYLLLVLNFYGLAEYLCVGVVGLILVLPITTTVLAFFGDPFGLLCAELEVLSVLPVYTVRCVPGVWYWAHVGFCVLLLSMGIYHAFTQHLRLPQAFRECSSLMVGAQIVITGTVFFSIVLPRGTSLVITILGNTCALVALYIAMINNDRMNYLFMARNHILDQLDTSVFILDNNRNILEANTAARESLRAWTGKSETDSLDGLLQKMREMGARFEDAVEGEQGIDVSISTGSLSRVYNVREDVLPDKTGRILGSFVTCEDVTRNRRLIRWLEQSSGTDALTGLPNRSSLALRRAEYESDEALPLSVIAGDVDGLKQVNDTLGHYYGDKMLVAIGQVLREVIPAGAVAYRTGGDEFTVILPNTAAEESERIAAAITQALTQVEIDAFQPSIALGIATRTASLLSLEEVMHQADQNMYRVKKNARRV